MMCLLNWRVSDVHSVWHHDIRGNEITRHRVTRSMDTSLVMSDTFLEDKATTVSAEKNPLISVRASTWFLSQHSDEYVRLKYHWKYHGFLFSSASSTHVDEISDIHSSLPEIDYYLCTPDTRGTKSQSWKQLKIFQSRKYAYEIILIDIGWRQRCGKY